MAKIKKRTIQSTKVSSFSEKKGYGKRKVKWTKKSVERERTYEWFLTESQAYDNDKYGVYLHSSVKNFFKSIRSNRLSSKITSKIEEKTLELSNILNKLEEQVRPTKEMRDGNILDIFKKHTVDLNQKTIDLLGEYDAIKKALLSYSREPAVYAMNTFRNNPKVPVNNKNGEQGFYYVSVIAKKDGDKLDISVNKKTKRSKTAINNLTNFFTTMFSKYEDSNNAVLKDKYNKALEDIKSSLPEEIAESTWDIVDEFLLEEYASKNAVTTKSGMVISPKNALSRLQFILDSVKDQVSEGHIYALNALQNINTISEFFKRKTAWAELGVLAEDLVGIDLTSGMLGNDVELVGSTGMSKHNTTDIMIKNITKTIDDISFSLGASLKQTVNFSKTMNSPISTEELNKIIDPTKKLINQYKYFMLNFTVLSQLEYDGQKSEGKLINEKRGLSEKDKEKKKYVDADIMSYAEIVNIYNSLSENVGKLFLVINLLGKVVNRTNIKNMTSFAKEDKTLPMVLVTQDYAVFTYDILKNMDKLLKSGAITMELGNVNTLKGMHTKLVNRKLDLYLGFDNNNPATSYNDLIADSEVQSNLIAINKKAFSSTDSGGGKLKMFTAIDMAKAMETIGGSLR